MGVLTCEKPTLAGLADADVAAVVWTGRPGGFFLSVPDWLRVLAALLIFCAGLFAFSTVHNSRPDKVLIAVLGAVSGGSLKGLVDLLIRGFRRLRTKYVLTSDGLAFIVSRFCGLRVNRVYLPVADTIQLRKGSGGTGTIWFGKPTSVQTPCFDGIADAVAVYDLCTKLQQGKSA